MLQLGRLYVNPKIAGLLFLQALLEIQFRYIERDGLCIQGQEELQS